MYYHPEGVMTYNQRPKGTLAHVRLAVMGSLVGLLGGLAGYWLGKPAAGVEVVDVRCAVPDKPTPPVKAEVSFGPVAEYLPPPGRDLVSLQTEYTYVECKCPRRAR